MSDLARRLEEARRDLVDLASSAPRERAWVPGCERMLPRGARALLAAPAKTGKSLCMLVHGVDVVLAGGAIAILDRENGADEYARRLGAILGARRATGAQRRIVSERLAYFEYPRLGPHDQDALALELSLYDLVTFDSSRAWLSSLALAEDKSDDYAAFMALVDPLARAGITTLILDNTGHEDKGRPRGTSSKADLNEVVLQLSVVAPFEPDKRGRIRLRRTHSRFGDVGESWDMELGEGMYGSWTSTGALAAGNRRDLHDAVVAILEDADEPLGVNRVLKAVRERGVTVRNDHGRELLRAWAAEPSSPIENRPGGGLATRGQTRAHEHPGGHVPGAHGHGMGTGNVALSESTDGHGKSAHAHVNGHGWAWPPVPTAPGVPQAPLGHGRAAGAPPRCSCATPADLTGDGRCGRCFGVPANGSLL
jgi:hypothetical protein